MKLLAKNLFKGGALIGLLLASQYVVYAQTSRIQGQVFGPGRRPVSDAYVELRNEVETVVQRTKTDGGGGYYFSNVSSGRFSVRVRPFGTDYEEQTQEVEIVSFVGGRQVADSQQKDFYLRERKASSRQPAAPGVIFAQAVPPEAEKAYSQGISHLESNRHEIGMTEIKNAIGIFPTYFLALDRMGVELIKQQKWAEAASFFDPAIAVHDKSANSWYGLAFSSYGIGEVDKALEAAKRASSLSPDSPDIQLLLGISLRRGQQFDDAEKALLRAKKLSEGRSPDVNWQLALLYAHNLKKYQLAAAELEAYLNAKPGHPNAALLRKLIDQWRKQA